MVRFVPRSTLAALACGPMLLSAAPALAQTATDASARGIVIGAHDSGAVRRINIGVGKSIIVDLPRDATEIFVGNPKVANAVVRSPRRIYIIAADAGQTTVFALDAQGQKIATFEISIGRDIDELLQILRAAMPTADVRPRTINDTIILTGMVNSAAEAQQAIDIAKGFVSQANASQSAGSSGSGASVSISGTQPNNDGKVISALTIRGKDQVMLKVTVAEVQRDVLKQFGVTSSSVAGKWGSFTQDNSLPLHLQTLSGGAATFSGTAGALSAAAKLSAFERYGVGRVLAEPTVTAVSGESAKFTAGGSLAVPSGESCGTDPTTNRYTCSVNVNFKPYGVTLNFTPVVLSEGRIILRVATEVTEVDGEKAVRFNTINVPSFRTRQHETTVELPSGGSIATAGLIQTKSRQVINGYPGIMNLPILGQLFRSRDYQREETELLIIVTAYIVKPVNPKELARPDDGFADASDPQSIFLGRVNRLYASPNNPQVVQKLKGRVGFIQD